MLLEKPQTETARSDREMAAWVGSGDEKAFDAFYARFAARLYTLAARLSGDRSLAEDMTQECFLHLLRKIGRYDGRAALSSWIHRVAVNFFISFLRKAGRPRGQESLDESDLAGRVNAWDRTGPGDLDRLDLERGLAGLPPGYRQVLALHDIEGCRHEEIADILGISVGTSKSQLHHARMKLRTFLKGG